MGNMSVKSIITGNQQKIMKESIICAYNVAMELLKEKNNNGFDFIDKMEEKYPRGLHIHTPDGGTEKDGPSAGSAFVLAFISILTDTPINNRVAITGEIDLTGKINKIGSLVSKLTGAYDAGIETVFICEENKKDYLKIKKAHPEIFEKLKIKIIKHIRELLHSSEIFVSDLD